MHCSCQFRWITSKDIDSTSIFEIVATSLGQTVHRLKCLSLSLLLQRRSKLSSTSGFKKNFVTWFTNTINCPGLPSENTGSLGQCPHQELKDIQQAKEVINFGNSRRVEKLFFLPVTNQRIHTPLNHIIQFWHPKKEGKVTNHTSARERILRQRWILSAKISPYCVTTLLYNTWFEAPPP